MDRNKQKTAKDTLNVSVKINRKSLELRGMTVVRYVHMEGNEKVENKILLSDKCPICGKEIEKGYLRCSSPFLGWGWVSQKKPWTGGYCIAEAHRCQNCNVIILSNDIIK